MEVAIVDEAVVEAYDLGLLVGVRVGAHRAVLA